MRIRHSDCCDTFALRWLAEVLRLREAGGGQADDPEAVAAARRNVGGPEARVLAHARVIGERDGTAAAIGAWQVRARMVLVLLSLLALAGGLGLAFAVLGDGDRPVNVVWALGGLLGVHVLSLALWLAGLWLWGRDGGSAFGRLWMWLSARLSPSGGQAPVTRALLGLYARGGLTRWWLGAVTHGVWLLMLGGALIGLLMAFAARGYGFVWETTILSYEVFERFVLMLGAVPAWLGFAVPDAELVRASGAAVMHDELARVVWSSWLIGCVVVYGILPRLLLWAVCAGVFVIGRVRVKLDLSLPAYAGLLARVTPDSERIGVTDAAPGRIATAHIHRGSRVRGRGAVLVGIELREDPAWPPALPAGVRMAGVLDTREQRKRFIAELATAAPARLLIACDPRLSPDRGTLALIAELVDRAGACRIWLRPGASSGDATRLGYWYEGLGEIGVAPDQVIESERVALDWLERAHAA